MLTITSLDEFRSKVKHTQEIREAEIAPGLISFCYMIAAEGTFDDAYSRECRGIVFDKETGKVVGRPLHKFFNVNEREETRPENLPSNIVRLMDKRDGSMIHTVKVGNTYRLKSKKSFDSDVAKQATEWINLPHNQDYDLLCHSLQHTHDSTAIFEYTAPDARIVLPYKKVELRLLHIRHNQSGRYWTHEELKVYAAHFNVNCVDYVDLDGIKVDVNNMIEDAKTAENIEGWILQFKSGEMVKLKCDWYLKRHRAMTFLRERDIAQLVLDEGLDDVKSMLVGDGVNVEDILKIEQRVVDQLNDLSTIVDYVLRVDGDMDRKEFALKYRQNDHFGLIMAAYTGKQPDYKSYFERNILREQYSLRQLQLMDTVAEPE